MEEPLSVEKPGALVCMGGGLEPCRGHAVGLKGDVFRGSSALPVPRTRLEGRRAAQTFHLHISSCFWLKQQRNISPCLPKPLQGSTTVKLESSSLTFIKRNIKEE